MAIAFDAAVAPASSSGTSLTISLTVGAGPNRQVRAQFFAAGGDIGTGAKCNGVSMTLIGKANTGGSGNNWIYVYGLINPAPGVNSIVFTCSGSSGYLVGTAASYTGASQTALTESLATVTSTTNVLTGTVTTVTPNAWLMFGGSFDGGATAQGNCDVGTTMRASAVAGGWLCDKGPVVAPASVSITLTVGVSGNWGGVISAMPAAVVGAALAATPSIGIGARTYADGVLADAPAGYWRLGDAVGPTAIDSSGHGNGTIVGGVTLGQPGAVSGDTAMQFDGIDGSYVSVPGNAFLNALDGGPALTMEAWINLTDVSLPSGIRVFYAFPGNQASYISVTNGGNGTPQVFVALNIGGPQRSFAGGPSLVPGTWYHVVVTYNGAALTLYVNGLQAATQAYTGAVTLGTAGLLVGGYPITGSSYCFKGRVDEAAIYPVGLTAAQVTARYASRNARGLSLPRITANRPDVGPGGPVSAVFTEGRGDGSDWIALYAVGAPLGDANFFDWFYTTGTKLTGPSGANFSGTIPFTAPLPPGLYEFRFHFQNSYTLVARSAPFRVGGLIAGTGYADRVLADAPLGYWRLNDAAGTVAADSSGNNHPGTISGGVTLGKNGALGDGTPSMQFDGTAGTGITITPPPALPLLVTIEAWIKPTASGPAGINYIWGSGSAVSFPCELAFYGPYLQFFINFETLTPGWTNTNYAPTLNVWAHVALTWDGITLRVFVDGSQVYANAAWAGLTIIQAGVTGGVRSIGWQGPGNDQGFNGYLDEVAYYNYALTARQIVDHVLARSGLSAIRFSTAAIFNAAAFASTPTIKLSALGTLTAAVRFSAAAAFGITTTATFNVARFVTTPIVRIGTVATLTTGTEKQHGSTVRILLAGVDARTRIAGLTIRDVLNDAPNSCTLTIDGSEAPSCEQTLRVQLNLDAPRLLFNGALQKVDTSYAGRPVPRLRQYPCTATDDTTRANRMRPFGTWVNVSATIYAQQLLAQFAPGITTHHVQPDLPPITIILDGTEGMSGALKQAATQIGGYFYFEDGDLHLFLEEVTDTPDPIDATPGRLLNDPPIRISRDDSQLRTRQCGRGHGEVTLADVGIGAPELPIVDATMFTPTGGRAITSTTPDGGPSQRIAYTGVRLGGGGSLVGVGASPTVAALLARVAGTGIDFGVHGYAYGFLTAAGESVLSPLASVTLGLIAGAGALSPTVLAGAGIDADIVDYEVTFYNAAGETAPIASSLFSYPTTVVVADPSAAPFVATSNTHASGFYAFQAGWNLSYKYSYITATGETLASAATPYTVVSDGLGGVFAAAITLPYNPDPLVTTIKLYRTNNGGGPHYSLTTVANTGTFIIYDSSTSVGGPTEPVANTTAVQHRRVALTNIPISVEPSTGRRIYRRNNAVGTFKLLAIINDTSTTSMYDTTPMAGLGANAPTVNTATVAQVNLSAIAVGPPGTTGRSVYRTAAGGTQLKRLATIANNTATVLTDAAADSTLGANAPTVDTSGLTQAGGQVLAGSTSLVTTAAAFPPTGGWVRIGSQIIRYTGITGNTLTGIPPSGPGSILTTVQYGTPVLPAPTLIGVTGVVAAILAGSRVCIWVQRDDLSAQAEQAAVDAANGIVPADGIYEGPIIVDERRGEPSLTLLCDATLVQNSRPIVTVTYACRDVKTKSGKTVVIDLDEPSIHEVLTIQEVTITEIDIAPGLLPRFSVIASSQRNSLDDIIRRLLTATDSVTSS